MLERTETRFGIKPVTLTADSAYGSADSFGLAGQRERHCPAHPGLRQVQPKRRHVLRADFAFDAERDRYTCPAGKELVQFRRTYAIPRSGVTAEGTRLIAPANWIATPADSNHSAARTLLPARSRGICTKTPATWPVRTPQLRNTWRPVAGERKSRCCSHISSKSFVWRVCV